MPNGWYAILREGNRFIVYLAPGSAMLLSLPNNNKGEEGLLDTF